MGNMIYCPHCMAAISDDQTVCPACRKKVDSKNKSYQLGVYSILNARYLVGDVIGEGGFGITYVGYDLKLNLKVAIKEYFVSGCVTRTHSESVTPTNTLSPEAFKNGKDKFLAEAKTLSKFATDDNVVRVRDYFEENNTAYIVMEFVEGATLHSLLSKNGPMTFNDCYNLLKPIMYSLNQVHAAGLIHRDISPSNIMIVGGGRAKLLDFGAARNQNITGEKSLSVMLKPGYAPAEQYNPHGSQGPWTDEYALCATIYKLITGITPETSTQRSFEDNLKKPSELGASITPEQEAVLLKGMSVDIKDRYSDIGKLIAAFENPSLVKNKKKHKNRADKKNTKKKAVRYIISAVIAFVMSAAIGVALTFVFDGVTFNELKKTEQKIESKLSTKTEKGDGYVIEERYLIVKEQWIDDATGEIASVQYYDYDENGWLNEVTYTYYYTYDGVTEENTYYTQYVYDEEGYLLKIINDIEVMEYNLNFGDDDNLYMQVFDLDGNLTSYETCDVIDDTHEVRTYYYPDGTVMSTSTYTFNEEGYSLYAETVDEEGNVSTTSYEYDGDMNMTSMSSESKYDEYEYYTQYTYEYDGYGRQTSGKRITASNSEYIDNTEETGTFEYEKINVKYFDD